MARITYLYRRGGYFWWRRRLRNGGGQGFTVALSLGVRDPDLAKRIGRRVSVEADALMTSENSPTPQETTKSLKAYILLAKIDLESRMHRDFELARPMSADDRSTFLGMRARNNRIFGALNEIAAAHGPIKEYSERIDGALAERGYKWHERDEIARRLEDGYAVEAYSSHSTVAGTPAQAALDAELRSQGYQPTIVNRADHYKTLASARAALEKSAERLNLLAIDDPAAAQKELHLRLPITRSFDDTNGIVPPYASSDAIERGEIEIFRPAGDEKIENGSDHDASRQRLIG